MGYTTEDEEEWEDYFDIILAQTKGPLFWRSEEPFYERDVLLGAETMGEVVDCVDQFRHFIILDKIFLAGNMKLLTKYLQWRL